MLGNRNEDKGETPEENLENLPLKENKNERTKKVQNG